MSQVSSWLGAPRLKIMIGCRRFCCLSRPLEPEGHASRPMKAPRHRVSQLAENPGDSHHHKCERFLDRSVVTWSLLPFRNTHRLRWVKESNYGKIPLTNCISPPKAEQVAVGERQHGGHSRISGTHGVPDPNPDFSPRKTPNTRKQKQEKNKSRE